MIKVRDGWLDARKLMTILLFYVKKSPQELALVTTNFFKMTLLTD